MDRNYPNNFNGNHSSDNNAMCAELYNELIDKQEQFKFNAENRTDNNVKR